VVRIASFNVFGIDGRDVESAVQRAAAQVGPAGASAAQAVGFQELFFQRQAVHVRNAWLGPVAQQFSSLRSYVRVWQSQAPGSWACLIPETPALVMPGFPFDNSSGLSLCVQGRLLDCFFDRYRAAQTPDRFAYKGIVAALVRQGSVPRVFVNTHLNNSSNDLQGHARAWQVEQLASDLRYIERHWRAPVHIVGDFNIDATTALQNPYSVDRALYGRLLSAARAPGQYLYDINTRVHGNAPIPTTTSGTKAIDLHLLDRTAGKSGLSFTTRPCDSDHLLTTSQWSEP
jgi:hypothetical protein